MAKPDGCVVDLHPSAAPALLEVGDRTTGRVDAADAPLRHAAAGVALAAVVDEGLFAIERALNFTFYTYGDTIEELREYIVENWRNAQIDDETVDRTREALGAGLRSQGVRPRVREQVLATKLRPLARPILVNAEANGVTRALPPR
jgi:hypothetical protein